MDFVNKEDNILTLTNFFHEFLHAFFKLATDTSPLNQADHIKTDHLLALEFLWHITVNNFLGKSFDYSGFTNTRLTDENRIVLGTAVKNFDDTNDFLVTTNDRINVSTTSNICDINSKFFKKALRLLSSLLAWSFWTAWPLCIATVSSVTTFLCWRCIGKITVRRTEII